MKIKNTIWQTISAKNKKTGDYELGYEAPATLSELRKLQQYGILVEVVGKTSNSMPRLIQPDNHDQQFFTPDQKFRIMETNKTFGQFEKALTTTWGVSLTDDRFDALIDNDNPNVWGKTDRGYCLRLSPLLSYEKKQILSDNLEGIATKTRTDKIFVEGKNVKALEFEWQEVLKQKKSNLIQMRRRMGMHH